MPVYAAVCTDEEMDSLELLADRIKVSKEFTQSDEGRHGFELNAYNLSNKLYIQLPSGLQVLTNKTESYLGNFWQDQELELEIYASDNSNCGDELLRTIKVKLERFNEYSKREECKNYQNLDICKQWGDTSKVSEEDFLKLIKDADKTSEEVESSSTIIDFIKSNIIYIIGGVVFLITLIIILKVYKDKKRIKIDL